MAVIAKTKVGKPGLTAMPQLAALKLKWMLPGNQQSHGECD